MKNGIKRINPVKHWIKWIHRIIFFCFKQDRRSSLRHGLSPPLSRASAFVQWLRRDKTVWQAGIYIWLDFHSIQNWTFWSEFVRLSRATRNSIFAIRCVMTGIIFDMSGKHRLAGVCPLYGRVSNPVFHTMFQGLCRHR